MRVYLMTSNSQIIKPLLHILEMERDQGYQNRAVAGGLDKLLQRWENDLGPILGDVGPYSILTPVQRESWVAHATERVLDSLDNKSSTYSSKNSPVQTSVKHALKSPAIKLDHQVVKLKGIGDQLAKKLGRLGILSVSDLVYHFPSRHNDYAKIRKINKLEIGETQTVIVNVWEVTATRRKGNPNSWSVQAVLGDETGNARATWFRPGRRGRQEPYLARSLKAGDQIVISGRVSAYRGTPIFKDDPEYEPYQDQEELVHTGRLVPVYSSTEGLTQKTIRKAIKQALDSTISQISEYLPNDSLTRTGVMGLQDAITQAHYPNSQADWAAARHRLAFDELLLLQLMVLTRKRDWQRKESGISLNTSKQGINNFFESLPFELTKSQNRVLHEMLGDLRESKPMNRLLQGDVGSGKTVIAASGLLTAIANGYQGAMMAPTEMLAEQHYLTISQLLRASVIDNEMSEARIDSISTPIRMGLLLGSLSRKTKIRLHEKISQGEINLVIGTHAIIQDDVEIPQLAFAVVDEQHRFGVIQRSSLRKRGTRPHLLSMSATPIPRSLALTLYGELDVSTIDEMPPGRYPVRTRWIEPSGREVAYGFVRKQIELGRQSFIVCPLIEGSEAIQSRAATEEYENLSTRVFSDLNLGLMHGRMPLRDKEQVMNKFKEGKLDILVSTSVIEVGIDVPNATVMLIDGADRFGLAQLHQFRGRVGRGQHQSYCLLLSDDPGEEARKRLKLLERINDGFQLSEQDLGLRGPGDYMGTRQSGLPNLKVARLTDQEILILARQEAIRILDSDPRLAQRKHRPIFDLLAKASVELPSEIS